MNQKSTGGVRAIVRGLVQGVGFRFFVRDEANALNVRGWVRNLPDEQSVEMLAAGPVESVETLVERVRTGPPGAEVIDVELEWIEPPEDLDHFTIRH